MERTKKISIDILNNNKDFKENNISLNNTIETCSYILGNIISFNQGQSKYLKSF